MKSDYKYTVSICIPTYNGEKHIAELLDSIISQLRSNMEIVLCDDNSLDSTYSILTDYNKKHENLIIYRNESNLGMDRNFLKTVQMAHGKYVWMCGQDDIFGEGVVDKFFNILKIQSVDYVYFNYKAMDDNLEKEVALSRLSVSNPEITDERFYSSGKEYFGEINHAPTFLPAMVMLRCYWEKTDVSEFYDTHYIQVGVWLSNFAKAATCVVGNKNYIICRNPIHSWKYTDASMHAELSVGLLYLYKLIFNSSKNCIPHNLMKDMEQQLLVNIVNIVPHYTKNKIKITGTKNRYVFHERLKYIFRDRPAVYYFYVLPFLHLPQELLVKLLRGRKITKTLKYTVRGLTKIFIKPNNVSITQKKIERYN